MKERFSDANLGPARLRTIDQANEIIEDFQSQGYRMTLRQLYYQFVSKNLITNEEKSYKNLASTISDGRLVGLIDWDAIEDRGRVADEPHHVNEVADHMAMLKRAANGFTLDAWRDQPVYVELWVEKQALAGVLEPLARRHHVTLMVNKGYSSQSAMYESAQRFREGMGTTGDRDESVGRGEDPWYDLRSDREGLLLYLGDHDPSGEDMVRDIRDRLCTFGCGEKLRVQKLALTMAQVKQYNPPPQPLKRSEKTGELSDSRGEAYRRKFGGHSWEVDALRPDVLSRLVTKAITDVIDPEPLELVRAEEKRGRAALVKALEGAKL